MQVNVAFIYCLITNTSKSLIKSFVRQEVCTYIKHRENAQKYLSNKDHLLFACAFPILVSLMDFSTSIVP